MSYKYFTDNKGHFFRVPENHNQGESTILHVNVSKKDGGLINSLDLINYRVLIESDEETFEQKICTVILNLNLIDFIP
jgi:hypothetical protein